MTDERLTIDQETERLARKICFKYLGVPAPAISLNGWVNKLQIYAEKITAEARKAALEEIKRQIIKDEFQMIVAPYSDPKFATAYIGGHNHAVLRIQRLLNGKLAASPLPEAKK